MPGAFQITKQNHFVIYIRWCSGDGATAGIYSEDRSPVGTGTGEVCVLKPRYWWRSLIDSLWLAEAVTCHQWNFPLVCDRFWPVWQWSAWRQVLLIEKDLKIEIFACFAKVGCKCICYCLDVHLVTVKFCCLYFVRAQVELHFKSKFVSLPSCTRRLIVSSCESPAV